MIVAVVLVSLLALSAGSPLDSILNVGPEFNGKMWAVLVAGSNGYYNYRHQADICHAYQVLKEHGIPEKQIVVMMYDDIANSDENPTKGVIINKPNGTDVYHGVPKDFTGEEVTPENFIKVLQGDAQLAAAGKKVIHSTKDDHIFVYFSDHGAPGLIAFPSSELDEPALIDALKTMHSKQRYAKMVLYIEACESGSMFQTLPDNINIFATTAANPTESSYAVYYDSVRGTYLGDEYSVHWIEDSDGRSSLKTETLEKQFTVVRKETEQSHVQQYGDLSISQLHVSQFQGPKTHEPGTRPSRKVPITERVPSPDVPIIVAGRKVSHANSEEEAREAMRHLNELLDGRQYMRDSVIRLVHVLAARVAADPEVALHRKQEITDFDCYQRLYKTFDANCFDLSTHPYGLRQLYTFVNLCDSAAGKSEAIRDMAESMADYCYKHVRGHSFKGIL